MQDLNGIKEVQNGESELLVYQHPGLSRRSKRGPFLFFFFHENLVRMPEDLAMIKSSAALFRRNHMLLKFGLPRPCSVMLTSCFIIN